MGPLDLKEWALNKMIEWAPRPTHIDTTDVFSQFPCFENENKFNLDS